MDNKELEKKIARIDLNSIYNTSPKALKELTNDYSEPLVRLLMMKAKTIGDQKGLLKYIKKAYAIWQKKTKILWSEHPAAGGYPEYFDTMEANIDSDRYITTSGSVPVGSIEYYQLMSQQRESKSSDVISKDMLATAISEVKAQIPHFEYDEQNEGLSIEYGDNKGKVNLDEVIEKKTQNVVKKQLEEMIGTKDDVDEIFADVYGQDLVNQVNKKMAEEDEECGEDEEGNYDEEEDYDEEDDNVEAPRVLKNKIKEDKVIEVLRNLFSDKVKGKRRWYVIYRVLLFIEWLRLTNQIDFINWVKSHFGWTGIKEFRGIQSEFTHSDPNKWNLIIIKGKRGKSDNEELGSDYYDFAVEVRDTFVDVDLTTGEMQDKDEFRANPHQGVLHNSKWK